MKAVLRYCILLLVFLSWQSVGFAQTNTGYEDKLILAEERDFILCNAEGKQFRTSLENLSSDDFKDGTFEVDLGDGEHVFTNLTRSKFPLDITYTKKGPFQLKFSAETNGGIKVAKVYTVTTLGKPEVGIKQKTADVQCVGNDVGYVIDVYPQNTSGTVYTLTFDDGTEPVTLTNDELTAKLGEVYHKYDHSYCGDEFANGKDHFEVTVEAVNECALKNSASIQENVVIPIHAAFTFDRFDGKNCTYEPVRLKNLTSGGTDIDCGYKKIYWEWDFGNGETSTQFEPEITYEEAKDYKITLKASNDFTCATDSATVSMLIIPRVIAHFEIDEDTICEGRILNVRNRTQGGELDPFVWSIVSLEGFPSPEIINGDYSVGSPQIKFDHYGHYRLTLAARNGCTEDRKDTLIVVQKDPNIQRFELAEHLCPPTLDMSGKVAYEWNGNEPRPKWTVTQKATGNVMTDVYANGTTSASEYPVFNLTVPGIYHIALELTGVGCGGTTLIREGDIRVYDPGIELKVTTTPLEVCENAQIAFNSTSTGDNLVHHWSYSPASNVEFIPGKDEHDKDPVLAFKKYGHYTVTLSLEAACGTKDSTFNVHVKKEPHIFYFDLPAAICPDEEIRFNEKMIYQFNGNPEEAEWTITPNRGFEYLEGTGPTSPYPVIRFTEPAVNYKVRVKIKPVGCSEEGITQEVEKTLRVRASAMKLKASATDTVVCEGEKIDFSMSATSEEGDPLIFNWSVSPADGSHDFGFIGSQSQVANIIFNHWGSYQVRGEASGFCGTLDSVIQVRIKKDPEVYLRDTSGMCPGVIDMKDYVSYHWFNNKEKVKWTITPVDGFEYVEGDAGSLYPKLLFKTKGIYDIRAELETADCRGSYLEARRQYEILDTTITVVLEPNLTDVCEGDEVRFRNMSSGVGLTYQWTITGPEDGYTYREGTDAQNPAPVLLFSKYGEYDLSVNITGTCNVKQKSFHITVRGIPDIELSDKMTKICAGSEAVDMSLYVAYKDRKNSTITPLWTISPAVGYTFAEGHGANSDFPRIVFNDNASYSVTLTVGSQCGDPLVRTAAIDVIRNDMTPLFSMPEEGCVPLDVVWENNSEGDSLTYTWSVTPHTASGGGWSFQGMDGVHTESPHVLFSEQGSYDITLNIENICGVQEVTHTLRSYAVPLVDVGDIADVCETFHLAMADTVKVTENNDALRKAKWTITPMPEFGDGFSDESMFPEVLFNHGNYHVQVEMWNGCSDAGVGEFDVAVDEFIPVPGLLNDTLCHLEPALMLTAAPENGIWTLDGAEDLLGMAEGKTMFIPSRPGDYTLVYSFTNGSCVASNIKKIKVHSLPVVDAGDDLEMCLNHEPKTLRGIPEGGWWEGAGVVSPIFTPLESGEVQLMYYYKDEHHCSNRDSIMMNVHPLPDTAFLSEPQYCRGIEAEFKPQSVEKKYIWDYGDLTKLDTVATGSGLHIYEHHGFYQVTLVVESVHGCLASSALREVEIVNDAPPAKFTLDKHAECGPEVEVRISLTEENYTDPNLHFAWDLGNGKTTESLLPENPQPYQSWLWDTTYYIQFKVYNICNETSMLDSILVGSTPKADFYFQHKWNCSPLSLKVLNASTGNGNHYTWYMGDGTIEQDVYTPGEHLYEAKDGTEVFKVSLVAQNNCGKDSVMKPLTVLAQTLEAFFETPKSNICVGEEICFTNRTTDTAKYVTYKFWDFGDEVRDTSWNACHVYQEGGKYKVFLYVDNGCGFDTISDQLTVFDLPKLDIQSEDIVCDQDSFHFSFQSDQDLQRWEWNFGDEKTTLEPAPQYVYQEPGTYPVTLEVMAKNIAFCKTKQQKEVHINPRPDLEITPFDTLVCPPWIYLPQVSGEAATFMWDYGDGSGQTSSMEHLYENETDSVEHHRVVLHAVSDKGCPKDFVGQVAVSNLPVADMRKEVKHGRPQKVDLINLSKDFTDCIWYLPPDRMDRTFADRHLEFMENGRYIFSLVALNQYGCKDSMSIEHEVLIKGLYFPNTFIPHSLNGKINHFNGIGMGLLRYKLEIFDQYYNKIWETQALENGKPSEGWDGCNLKGERMPQGMYIWRAEAIFADDEVWTGGNNESGIPETTQGSVLLLRE